MLTMAGTGCLEKRKKLDSTEGKVTTVSPPKPPELSVLSPPHTQLSHGCFAVPAGVSRKDETPGFFLPSPVIQEEEESSALLKECGRGVLAGLFSAVLKGF